MCNHVAKQLSWIRIDGTNWARVVLGLGVELVVFAVGEDRHLEEDLVVASLAHGELLEVLEEMGITAFAFRDRSCTEVFVNVGEFDGAAILAFVALFEGV